MCIRDRLQSALLRFGRGESRPGVVLQHRELAQRRDPAKGKLRIGHAAQAVLPRDRARHCLLYTSHRNPPVSLPTTIPMWSKYKPLTRKYHSIKPNTIAPAGNRRALRITSPRPRKRKKAPSETAGALPTAPIVPHADYAEYHARGNRYPERYSPRRPLLRQLSPQGSCRL